MGGKETRVHLASIEQPPRKEGDDPSAAPPRHVRFTEMAAKLGLLAPPADDALILDVEDDQDVDLLVTGGSGNAWFENLRELRFRLSSAGRMAHLDVMSAAVPVSVETVSAWQNEPLQAGGESSTLSLRDIAERHGGDLW